MQEKKIQNQILREFATKPEMRLWRANVGRAVPIAHIKLIEQAVLNNNRNEALNLLSRCPMIRFGIKGQADLNGILDGGTRLEIEVKSEKGKQSKEQIIYENMITNKGGIYILARSVKDVFDRIFNFLK